MDKSKYVVVIYGIVQYRVIKIYYDGDEMDKSKYVVFFISLFVLLSVKYLMSCNCTPQVCALCSACLT